MGHVRSFGGHLVTPNSNLVSATDSGVPKKLYKDLFHAPE